MTKPTILITVLTVAAVGTVPGTASAAPKCDDGGSCRIAVNHNEILVTSPQV